ncbi:MAG: hypothetical protein JZU53_01445 [Paludibacter sp.]|nr:hypothetical protein [Paludibacter sp.]
MIQCLKIILFSFLVLLLFASCEYELSGEFNSDIKKPANSHEASITLSKDMDSIVIFEPTDIQYSVNSFGLQCNGIELEYLNTKITNQYSSAGIFNITPDFSITGWFDLKSNFYLGTGSGSIADKFRAENYIGSKTWKVCFMDLTKYDFQAQYRINKDGFLELFWIKPSFLPTIESDINTYATIHPHISKIVGDTTFFADSTYYGGTSKDYTLRLILNNRVIYQKTMIPNYPFPELKITPLGLDSALVSWTKSPLKLYYKAYYGNAWQHYIFTGFESSFRAKCLLGIDQEFFIEIYPYDYKNNVHNYKTISSKIKTGESANYKFNYSYVKDQFYIPSTLDISKLEKVDITTAEGNAYANKGIYKYELYGNHLGTRFVAAYSGEIHIFDESLNEVRKIIIAAAYDNYGGQMTTDDCYAYFNYDKGLYNILNVGTNLTWQQFSFKPAVNDESNWGSIRLSLDGKYAFWRGDKYFTIYDVSNHLTADIVYQCPNSEVYHFMGNPLNYKEVIISKSDKIEVRSLPDFRLLKQINLPGEGNSYLLTVDTYSNSFLALSQNNFHVINLTNMKELLKFNGAFNNSTSYTARLHKNNFFINGTKTDLTPYLKKP